MSKELYSQKLFGDASLLAYYRFQNNSNDSRGGNNGTDTAMTYNGLGKFYQGATLNGSTSKVVITDTASWHITSNFTIHFWMNAATPAAFGGILWDSAQVATTSGILVGLDTAGKIYFRSSTNTSPDTPDVNYKVVPSITVVGDSTWRMITCVWNGSSMIIYVNGVVDNSAVWGNAAAYQATNYVRIGCDNLIGGADIDFYPGKLDDLAVFTRALTAVEVANLYWVTSVPRVNLRPRAVSPGLAR